MAIETADFTFVQKLVRERAAIVLDNDKSYLVESRLLPVARLSGCPTLGALIGRLKAEPFNNLHTRVIEAMTTNETSFFRDRHPFDALKTRIIPELLQSRAAEKTLSFWCGASSTGQEPYTVLMVLRESFPQLKDWKLKYYATDINKEVLQRAREGRYSQMEVNRGLPAALLLKYFDKKGLDWQIKDEFRAQIDFREMNLAGSWLPFGQLDVVWVRNVMIYFDVATKKEILGKIRRTLKPDGYLFLGGAETTMNLDDNFERVQLEQASCYQLRKTASVTVAPRIQLAQPVVSRTA